MTETLTRMESGVQLPLMCRLNGLIEHADMLQIKAENLSFRDIPGAKKLERKVAAEYRYLSNLQKKPSSLDGHQLNSSNLVHIEGIIEQAETSAGMTAILKPVQCGKVSVVLDVVCDGGATWKKIVARKAQALHLIWSGEAHYGQRNLLDQASDYLLCAAAHRFQFAVPSVEFHFYKGITCAMAEALESEGIKVVGDRVQLAHVDMVKDRDHDKSLCCLGDCSHCVMLTSHGKSENCHDSTTESGGDFSGSWEPIGRVLRPSTLLFSPEVTTCEKSHEIALSREDLKFVSDLSGSCLAKVLSMPIDSKVNLDISSMIAMVSSLTHGRCHYLFSDAILTEQAAWERETPVMPSILSFIEGKIMFACQTAIGDFIKIVNTIGGVHEIKRARQLLSFVTVMDDGISKMAEKLDMSGKVKARSKVVFGFGDLIQAVTLTANAGFHRAAQGQGVDFAVFTHGSRALTEKKEQTARPITGKEV